jgi:hypothetical protein
VVPTLGVVLAFRVYFTRPTGLVRPEARCG